jgi:uncharacterized protein (TIGR02145 family)
MKLKSRKTTGRNLAKFLIAVTVLSVGISSVQCLANAITITNITPNTGSITGGKEVTIAGDFAIDPTPTTLQQMTADYCTNEMSVFPTADTKPDTVTLTDTRNNQGYRIRKLADNNCWMIDNLKLELKNGMTLTSKDTNITTNTTIYFTQDGTKDGEQLGGMTDNFTTNGYLTRDGSGAPDPSKPDNYDAWRQADPNETPNCQNSGGGVNYNDDSTTGCGYLYNFYTAVVGTAPYTFDAQYSTVPGSICPAGWRLPTGMIAATGTDGDFQNLDVKYGGNGAGHDFASFDTRNLWLPAGAWQSAFGGYYNSSLASQGLRGYYWSASASSANYAYIVDFSSSNIYPGTVITSRSRGLSVRCVIDENHVPAPVAPVVTVGGKVAQITAWSDMSITFIAPAHLAGKVDIVVSRGSQTFTLTSAYEYFNVPDVPDTGVTKTSATTTVVQSGLAALIIIAIATVTFVIKHKKTKQR